MLAQAYPAKIRARGLVIGVLACRCRIGWMGMTLDWIASVTGSHTKLGHWWQHTARGLLDCSRLTSWTCELCNLLADNSASKCV